MTQLSAQQQASADQRIFAAHDVRKTFQREDGQQVVALDGISLELQAGALNALVGPDGAGKTTLIRLAAGLMTADSGQLTVVGYDPARQPQQIQDRIGYMPQRFGLYEDLSVEENLNLYADLNGVTRAERKQRYPQLLEMTALGPFGKRLAGRLSGGMKQKLGLACTLVRSPELLLLDEPTVGVDPQSRSHMMDTVRNVSAEGVAVIYASHYMEEVQAICERVAIIDHGQMLACDSLSTLLNRVTCDVFLRVRGSDKLASLLQGAAEVRHATDGEALVVIATEHGQTKAALNERLPLAIERLRQAGIEIKSVETRESNLERLFLELTGRKLRD